MVKPKGKSLLLRQRGSRKDIIEMDFKEVS
jgi:hypothetical protein